ncbi:MAG: glycosyltransferase family 2 protein [Candidatus Eremiobacteraeota bacterium]|nr:glycosyltransferase family 2 protein [Candidatus Eremiobacteraeota bacterium]
MRTPQPMAAPLNTPVVLWLHRRPGLTGQVFSAIREARPRRLFLIADGPKPGQEADCAAARAVVDAVDWECRVERNFSETNLGIRERIVSGINWVFEQVEEAILLEDDTLCHPGFFGYCQELLERYRDQPEVQMICGTNPLGAWESSGDYFFSRYGAIWGWATWRRAWKTYDSALARYRELDVEALFHRHLKVEGQADHAFWRFRLLSGSRFDTWDLQWLLGCALQGGYCAVPTRNLVRNIGFGGQATHTVNVRDPRSLPLFSLPSALTHPPSEPPALVDEKFERWSYWMHLLSRLEQTPQLRLWSVALSRNPDLRVPTPSDSEAKFYLEPLRHPEELRELLLHLEQVAPENDGVIHLKEAIGL